MYWLTSALNLAVQAERFLQKSKGEKKVSNLLCSLCGPRYKKDFGGV
ncbi:hypothetical protein PULV_a1370 [Pseudoalteromonas ulvae UL12]|nr:hypothetical protein [Pseudoalteromonas ulvae UL12]